MQWLQQLLLQDHAQKMPILGLNRLTAREILTVIHDSFMVESSPVLATMIVAVLAI